MNAISPSADTARYLHCIEASKAGRWDIDRDVIRSREFDFSKKFLPDGLSRLGDLTFLGADEKRLAQTPVNVFVDHFVSG